MCPVIYFVQYVMCSKQMKVAKWVEVSMCGWLLVRPSQVPIIVANVFWRKTFIF